jgi:hypothetical protein
MRLHRLDLIHDRLVLRVLPDLRDPLVRHVPPGPRALPALLYLLVLPNVPSNLSLKMLRFLATFLTST